MKLLVTGGAGFIGSNFIRYWINKYKIPRRSWSDATYVKRNPDLKKLRKKVSAILMGKHYLIFLKFWEITRLWNYLENAIT